MSTLHWKVVCLPFRLIKAACRPFESPAVIVTPPHPLPFRVPSPTLLPSPHRVRRRRNMAGGRPLLPKWCGQGGRNARMSVLRQCGGILAAAYPHRLLSVRESIGSAVCWVPGLPRGEAPGGGGGDGSEEPRHQVSGGLQQIQVPPFSWI